ncbi:hypothetical protein FKM82_028870 [Ascaphus truei]
MRVFDKDESLGSVFKQFILEGIRYILTHNFFSYSMTTSISSRYVARPWAPGLPQAMQTSSWVCGRRITSYPANHMGRTWCYGNFILTMCCVSGGN